MAVVAGTPIQAATDDDRAQTWIISDLHVPTTPAEPNPAVLEHFEAVCAAAAADRPESRRLLILGDLFEFYVNHRQLRLPSGGRVATAIRAAVDAGVSVSVVHGNRDFLLGARFARRTGCRVVAGGLRFRLDGRVVFGMHGDEFCLRDLPYQRSKRILRSAPLRWIARNLPLSILLWAGRTARRKSGGGRQKPRESVDPERFAPVASAVGEAFAAGADTLVFGHIHDPAHGAWESGDEARAPGGGGEEYFVLPAFDAMPVGLESAGSALRYRRFEAGRPQGEALEFPPRAFSS